MAYARARFKPFKPEDLDALDLDRFGPELDAFKSIPAKLEALVVPELAYSMWMEDRVIAAAGLLPQHEGRAMAWMLIGRFRRRLWLPIFKLCNECIERGHARGYRRIEATVDADYGPGIRWIERLGFQIEGLLQSYSPEGRDHLMYARLV